MKRQSQSVVHGNAFCIDCCLIKHAQEYFGISHHNITDNDKLVAQHILSNIHAQQFSTVAHEFYKGAYIFMADGGHAYEQWTHSSLTLTDRDGWSSHFSIDPQHSYNSTLFGEMLFGTCELNGEKGTWLQLEAYSTDWNYLPMHLYTYAYHKITGENVGPYGTSSFTEKNPLVLNDEQSIHVLTEQATDVLNIEDIIMDSSADVLNESAQGSLNAPDKVVMDALAESMIMMPTSIIMQDGIDIPSDIML